jgi:molecular chaperone DnaK (HSP70)
MDVDPEAGIALGAALAATKRAVNRRITARYGTVEPPPDNTAAPPVLRPQSTRIGRVITKKRFTAITDAQVPDFDPGFGAAQRPTLIEVIAGRLALSTVGGFCDEIIPANEPVPASKTRVFTTGHDNQREVQLRVCQGDSRRYAENRPLGALVLDELPPRQRGEVRIAVTFAIDDDGVLEASARDEQTGQERSVRIQLDR